MIRIGFIYAVFLFTLLTLSATETVRIADATPAGDSAVSALALQLSFEKNVACDISIMRTSPEKGLAQFNSGRIDLLLIAESDLPPEQKMGIRQFYATGAAVFYVHPANPLDDVSPDYLLEVLRSPAWGWNGEIDSKVLLRRLGLRTGAPGSGLPERMIKLKPEELDQNIIRVGSNAELQLFVASSREALGAGIFASEMPDNVKALKINGIVPSLKTIKDGSYPLCERYVLLYSADLPLAVKKFIGQMAGAEFRRELLQSGRIPLLP